MPNIFKIISIERFIIIRKFLMPWCSRLRVKFCHGTNCRKVKYRYLLAAFYFS